MLNKNATCRIEPSAGFDIHGAPAWGPAVTEGCAVVYLNFDMVHTTVRADGSASRGHGDEFNAGQVQILVEPNSIANIGARITVYGVKVKVTGRNPGIDPFTGKLDHWQLGGELCP